MMKRSMQTSEMLFLLCEGLVETCWKGIIFPHCVDNSTRCLLTQLQILIDDVVSRVNYVIGNKRFVINQSIL